VFYQDQSLSLSLSTLLVVFFLDKRRAATRSLLKERLAEARYKAVMWR